MNEYIKTNNENEIIDVFYDHQDKFDGTEIFTGDKTQATRIRNISNEYGVFIYTWDGTKAVKKTAAVINNDPDFLIKYKLMKKDELQQYIGSNLLTVIKADRSLLDIVEQYTIFVSNASSWNTKAAIDGAFNSAISWLNS